MRTRVTTVFAATALSLVATAGLAGCSSHPTEALSKLAHVNAGELPTPAGPELPAGSGTLYGPSLRLLGHYDGSAYWVGATTDDRVCFMAVTTKVDESSCVTPSRFGADGATLPVGEDEQMWLYLGYMTVPTDKGWRIVADNLAVR